MAASKTRRPAAPTAPQQAQLPTGNHAAVHAFRRRWRAVTVLLLAINTAGYWLAMQHAPAGDDGFATSLSHLFIVGAILTIACGLILPGRVSRTANDVAGAANRLASGTLTEITRALRAIAIGNYDGAGAQVDVSTLPVGSSDELGRLAACFNHLQSEIARLVIGLDGARSGLQQRKAEADQTRSTLRQRVRELAPKIEAAQRYLTEPKPAAAAVASRTSTSAPAAAPAARREKPSPKPAPANQPASNRSNRPEVPPQFSATPVVTF